VALIPNLTCSIFLCQSLNPSEEAKEVADNNRLIPPFSLTATEPNDIYPLHAIIPETEWKALSISAFDAATSNEKRIALLPHSRSQWVAAHMRIWGEPNSGKERKKNLYGDSRSSSRHR